MTKKEMMHKNRYAGRRMFFTYDHLEFRYEPYPIGRARPLMEPGLYRDFVQGYPAPELFAYLPKVGHKYTLSEKSNPDKYIDVIRSSPVLLEFHRWIKSQDFILGVVEALRERHIDIGYAGPMPALRRLRKLVNHLGEGRLDWGPPDLSARFEFSMLPADGGSVIPHTDTADKIITLIVSIVDEGEWNPAFGGGTDINRHRDATLSYNELNRRATFEEMEVIDTFAFEPNQAVVFVKTFNSWHSVRPMTGTGSAAMRRTLTINIEKVH